MVQLHIRLLLQQLKCMVWLGWQGALFNFVFCVHCNAIINTHSWVVIWTETKEQPWKWSWVTLLCLKFYCATVPQGHCDLWLYHLVEACLHQIYNRILNDSQLAAPIRHTKELKHCWMFRSVTFCFVDLTLKLLIVCISQSVAWRQIVYGTSMQRFLLFLLCIKCFKMIFYLNDIIFIFLNKFDRSRLDCQKVSWALNDFGWSSNSPFCTCSIIFVCTGKASENL